MLQALRPGDTPAMCATLEQFKKGSSRLRRRRYSSPNQVYHITTTTRGRQKWFQDFALGRIVVDALHREAEVGHAKTLAFVVMPDHVHWLMDLNETCSLSTTVSNVKSIAARNINVALSRTGPIWQPGFFDRAMRREEDLTSIARYIVANPLRAKLVKRIGDYPLWDAVWL